MRRAAVETGLQQPPATSIATIKPSYYCPPVTSSLATRRIALLRMRPPRVSKIPIAGRAASPRTIARGFVLWRLSDAGHRALGFSCMARHPKPCTLATECTATKLHRRRLLPAHRVLCRRRCESFRSLSRPRPSLAASYCRRPFRRSSQDRTAPEAAHIGF